MKTYTVVLSYFNGDGNSDDSYTNSFLDIFLDHTEAMEYADIAIDTFGAKKIVEYTNHDHNTDRVSSNHYTGSIIHIIEKKH